MEPFIGITSWIRIFLSPVFAAAGIGVVLYINFGSESVPYIWILGIIGVVFGVLLAERIRRKKGTHDFLSEITSSKDIKDYNFEQNQKKDIEDNL